MTTLNQHRRKGDIRPLASIPNKDGYVLIGVRKDGSEAQLTVFLDASGQHTVPEYNNLVGWKLL